MTKRSGPDALTKALPECRGWCMSPTRWASIRRASRGVKAVDVPRRTRMHSRVIWTMSVGRAPGSARSYFGGLERDVRVVIGVLRRMIEPEERRVPVLVERVLDRVGPDARRRPSVSCGRRIFRTSVSARELCRCSSATRPTMRWPESPKAPSVDPNARMAASAKEPWGASRSSWLKRLSQNRGVDLIALPRA